MKPIDFLENEDLLQFFHSHKTEMACMENPRIFLTQLRDHNLVPEDRYQKMSRMRSKVVLKNALYDYLDWLEKERPELIDTFWKAAFKDVTMEHYPTLRKLHISLLEEMSLLGNEAKQEAKDERRRQEFSENEEEEETNTTPAKKKMRKVKGSTCEEEKEKQSKPLDVETPLRRRTSRKVHMSTPLKKGEKSDIWMWPFYKVQLPVRCGAQEGLLDRNQMAKGGKCIMHNKRWFTPSEFEKFAGKESCKKWKETIQCMNTPLGKLIQEGHLKWARSRHRTGKARKSLFAASVVSTDESRSGESDPDTQPSTSREQRSSWSTEEELDEEAEQEPKVPQGVSNTVFKVTCGSKFGALHKERFALGTRGKCIRTETSWMTPKEFVEEALGQTDTYWKRDIQWEGKPIIELIKADILMTHSLMCNCMQCKPDAEQLENQRNDDECWVCKSGREDLLVICDECPRSFHQKCHLPHIGDAICKDKSRWLCTYCVFKTNQTCIDRQQSREAAMSRNTSHHMLECQYLLLRLCTTDEHVVAPNSNPSSEQLFAVYQNIRQQLDLIADKLNGKFYHTVGEFVSNLELVLATFTSKNQDAALIAVGDRLKKMFNEDFKNVFIV